MKMFTRRQRECVDPNSAEGEWNNATRSRDREPALQQTAGKATRASDAPPIVHDVSRSSGQPLDPDTRALAEPRFGHNFGRVRVHTDAKAAESARLLNARAYTVGGHVTFADGEYRPSSDKGLRLLAHELAHVVQQRDASAISKDGSLKVSAPDEYAEREADQVADALVSRPTARRSRLPHDFEAIPVLRLQRQAAETTVSVTSGGSTAPKNLPQGKGGSGAVIYSYSARAQNPPKDKDPQKEGLSYNISLPVLVYPPATLKPPKVNLFVFFHGMRADYGEGKSQGSEPIALWSHLAEAVAGTDRVGIAPQAPATWRTRQKKADDPDSKVWEPATAQWNEALANVGFDGLVKIALDGLTHDLGLTTPLVPGDIHVAGHSAGGKGITEATNRKRGARALADMVQDVTLQDAGYPGGWDRLLDWFLDGSPGKTVRVLMSQGEGAPASKGGTRSVLTDWFNVKTINQTIANKNKSETLKAEAVNVPDPKDQKPRPGGFVLESQLIVKNKKTGDIQGTMVAFFHRVAAITRQ